MKAPRIYANVQFVYKDPPPGARFLGEQISVGKSGLEPASLAMLVAGLATAAAEFTAQARPEISGEELTRQLHLAAETLLKLEFKPA